VLLFLKQSPGTKYAAVDVGRAVRPTVVQSRVGTIDGNMKILGNWANKVLNKLLQRHLVQKEGHGRGKPMLWWAD